MLNPNDSNPLKLELKCEIEVIWCANLVKRELDQDLPLYINQNKDSKKKEISLKLNDCLESFMKEEKIEYKCEKCLKDNDEKIKEKVTKKEKFTKLPPVLILTLQRFKTRKTYSQKINCLIEFPLTDLKIENEEYDLYGVINHNGTIQSGHYTAIINLKDQFKSKNKKNDSEWVMFNDSTYQIISKEKIQSEQAYILVYINKNKESKSYQFINTLVDLIQDRPNGNIFFEGEPIIYDNKEGYIEDIKKDKVKISFLTKPVPKKEIKKILKIEQNLNTIQQIKKENISSELQKLSESLKVNNPFDFPCSLDDFMK